MAPENTELAAAIQTGFERVIADGSYQRLVEEAIMTSWLRRQLKLRSRRILVLQNPEAADVLADVNPDHWIVPGMIFSVEGLPAGMISSRLRD